MTTWGEFRASVRRTLLSDANNINWSDDVLADAFRFAQDIFASHTALVSSVEYTGATGLAYTLPDDVYDENILLVSLESNGDIEYLKPSKSYERISRSISYEVFPRMTITLSEAPIGEKTLKVRYFAYYPAPASTSDVLLIPRWAEAAVGYLTAAFCLSGKGVSEAGISQWDDRTDAGNPEHSAMRKQHAWYMQQYEYMIRQYPVQDRETYFNGTS